MKTTPRVLGVIPARGGSRRVPRKNLREFGGKPLIVWTIDAAHEATSLTSLVVSTEDYEIEKAAREAQVHVIRRPDELAEDAITSGAVVRHAYDCLGEQFDMLVLLHPTSPIRNPRHIDEAIAQLWASEDDTLASVHAVPRKPFYNVFESNGAANQVGIDWIANASIYAAKQPAFDAWADGDLTTFYTEMYEMDRFHSLDINEEIDFAIGELYLERMNGSLLRERASAD